MPNIYQLHFENPQPRRLVEIVNALKQGAIMLYPTDTVYAIGCDLESKTAIKRVREIKQLSNDKPLTFCCSSLSNISDYAVVTDQAYRIMKHLIPGPYTFLLPATKLVPKLVLNPKRKTTGIRVPNHPICQALLATLNNPIISTSAHLADDSGSLPTLGQEKARLFDNLANLVDIIIDDDLESGTEFSTILDLSDDQDPQIIRKGLGWENLANWL
ncbi:MAG: threonylcarbamoyl-AMP synthase [Gloeocapsa sp. DLM2.Bin57]|nr:MAG: threonylcarbamoyl-AMP synthase [Gloeocapsa sp. DLM2.Bin57]